MAKELRDFLASRSGHSMAPLELISVSQCGSISNEMMTDLKTLVGIGRISWWSGGSWAGEDEEDEDEGEGYYY